jgi:hypothetical protein
MKRFLTFTLLVAFLSGFALTSCVKAKPGCKKAHKRIKNLRKNNSHFTM